MRQRTSKLCKIMAFIAVGTLHAAFASDALKRDDLQWLNRITYGANSETIAAYKKLGRRRFLDQQLSSHDAPLPPQIAQLLSATDNAYNDPLQQLAAINLENQRINSLSDEAAKQDARKALNDRGNRLAYEAARADVLRAVYSPTQLREQLTWFWLNHFNVFQYKANARWLLTDYEDRAIRPNVLGHFRDLVLATLQHPAMLQYLDNAQNAVGHLNENYARELMELHTLGVDAGYSQQDVQELARVLTGVGINANTTSPKLKPEWQALYRREGAFEFNPAHHDFGNKSLLGKTIAGGGFDEIERAVDLLVSQPTCARFVTRKLAFYFLGSEPSPDLQTKLSKIFQSTRGDIAAVLKVLFDSREFNASLGNAFKDPMHYVVSMVRIAYDGQLVVNAHPIVNWLNALGEPLYGRQSPDGYPLDESSWNSSGQLSKRFEIARAIATGNSGLFEPEDGTPPTHTGFPKLSSPLFFHYLEPQLSDAARSALSQASSQTEWNTYLLASPDFNYR